MRAVLSIFRRLAQARVPRRPWETASDIELAIAARVQDREGKEAFVEIVRRHQTTVCALAFSVTGRIGLTDDVAQETFLRAWKRMATLREPAKLKAWLSRIARDCAVDALRRERPHAVLDDEIAGTAQATEAPPDQAAADAEDEHLVWSALAGLPESLRTPLVLFYREGQSVAAVAAALDLSEDAVKQRLSRGRNALREQVAAKIEGALGRVRPPAFLIVTIAAAIGLLAAPAAMAAGAFSATASAAGTTTGGSGAAASSFSTAMTASSYLVATLTMAVFVPLGWKARESHRPPAGPPAASSEKPGKPRDAFADFPHSALLKEWRRLHEIHGTGAEAMPDLYQSISDVKDTFQRRALRSALLAEWAAVDPQGAFRVLLLEKKQPEQGVQFMREWLGRDPAAAAAHLAAHAAGAVEFGRVLLTELARLAPESMVVIAAHLPATERGGQVAEAFAIFATAKPAAARAAAEKMTGPYRAQALAGAAQGWAEHDGPAALAWSRSLEIETERDSALRATLIGWARANPLAALDHIDAAPPGKEELSFASDTAAKVLGAAAEKDFDATLTWLEKNSGKIGRESWLGLTGAMQKRLGADPGALLQFVISQPPTVRHGLSAALDSVMLNEGYAQKNAVWAWLKAQPPGEAVDALRGMMLRVAGWKEPSLAFEWMQSLPDHEQSKQLAEQQVSNLVNAGASLDGIDTMLAKIPEKLRADLLVTAFRTENDWSVGDLATWVERIAQLPPDQRPQAAASLAGRMTSTDPQAAVQWAASLTEPDQRQSAMASVITRWANADSYEASQWIASLPAGTDRDTAAHSLAGSIGGSEPDSAWTWGTSIRDAGLRRSALQSALAIMKERDPQRARELLNTPGLTDTDRASLLPVFEGGQPAPAPALPR